MAKRLASICVLLAFGLCLGVATSEMLVRLVVPLSDFLWQWDPLIGMKLIPGKHGRSVKAGLYDVDVEVNSVGFRDQEHTLGKPSGTCRIAILGDSFMEALQVPFESSTTHRLQKELQTSGLSSETMNFGVSGASTAREYLTMRSYALPYRPDLVVLFFVVNDFGGNTRELKGLSYLPYPQTKPDGTLVVDEKGHPVFAPFYDQQSRFPALATWLRDYSKTYRLIRELMDTLPTPADTWDRVVRASGSTAVPQDVSASNADLGPYEIYRSQLKAKWSKATRVTEQLLVEMRDLATENGAEFAVVLVPPAFEVYPERWRELLDLTPQMKEAELQPDQPLGNLQRFLDENRVRVINLLPDFTAHVREASNLYLRDDGHWTAAGHAIAAHAVSEFSVRILNSKSRCANAPISVSN
jgi:lysophospholipase L1-like esterase